MNRSIIISAVVLILLFSFLIWKGFLSWGGGQGTISEAVPSSSIAAFQFNDFNIASTEIDQSVYKEELNTFDWYKKLTAGGELIDQLIEEEYQTEIKQKLGASFHFAKAGEYDFLYLLPSKSYGKNPFKLFRRALKSEGSSISTNRFKNTLVYNTNTSVPDFEKLSFAECEGVILFSKYATLVEEGIATLKGSGENDGVKLKKTKSKSGSNRIGFHSNFNYFNTLKSITGNNSENAITNWLYKTVENFNGDIYPYEDRLIINGRLDYEKSDFLNSIINYPPVGSLDIDAAIPDDAVALYAYNTDNFNLFMEELIERAEPENADFLMRMARGLGNQWALAFFNDDASQLAYVFKMIDGDVVNNNLKGISSDADNDEKIKRVENKALIKVLSRESDFKQFPSAYYSIHSGKLIMGNSKSVVDKVVKAINTGRTINKTTAYSDFKSNLGLNTAMLVYLRNHRMKTRLESEFPALTDAAKSATSSFYPAIFQLYPVNKNMFVNGILSYQGKGLTEKINLDYKPKTVKKSNKNGGGFFSRNKKEKQSKWTQILGAKAAIKPQAFTNHYSGNPEVVIQDENNQLYLLNEADSILWQRAIDGKMQGKLLSYDYFNNNKLQLLFNTNESIYLIDRIGRDVKSYPIKLKNGASNAMTVVTYKDVDKTRFFVAGEDGNIYGFEPTGKVLNGWEAPSNLGTIKQPLIHFIEGGKDYLAVINEKGMVYLLSRGGSLRTENPIALNLKGIKSFELGDDATGRHLIVTDTKGKKYQVKVDGSFKLL